MKKVTTGIFAGALSIVVLAWGFDAMGRSGHDAGSGGHHDAALADAGSADERDGARSGISRRALSGLELTDEQQEKIKTLRSAYARDMVQLRADSRLARIDLNELMGETSPDLDKVKELAAAVSAARGSVFERGAVFRAEFKNVLTPEQQEKLRESFRGRRDGRRDSGMRGQRGGRESRNRR